MKMNMWLEEPLTFNFQKEYQNVSKIKPYSNLYLVFITHQLFCYNETICTGDWLIFNVKKQQVDIWIDLEFRHILICFLYIKTQRFSESQIFFFVFSLLISIFFPAVSYQPYLSKLVYHLAKEPRHSMKSKVFIAKTKIPPQYFGADFS